MNFKPSSSGYANEIDVFNDSGQKIGKITLFSTEEIEVLAKKGITVSVKFTDVVEEKK